MNGDGFDDLIVGARCAEASGNAKTIAGESYVIFGKSTGFADIDLATLTAAQGFRIFGADADDLVGHFGLLGRGRERRRLRRPDRRGSVCRCRRQRPVSRARAM